MPPTALPPPALPPLAPAPLPPDLAALLGEWEDARAAVIRADRSARETAAMAARSYDLANEMVRERTRAERRAAGSDAAAAVVLGRLGPLTHGVWSYAARAGEDGRPTVVRSLAAGAEFPPEGGDGPPVAAHAACDVAVHEDDGEVEG